MENQIIQVIANMSSGAVAGYVTNDIAIKMLFKKYLGVFGGVIEKTRVDFEINMSEFIEDEVINHDTLRNELKKPKFKKELLNVIEDFYGTSLIKGSKEKILLDIAGYEKSKASFINVLEKDSDELLAKTLESVSQKVFINELIDKEGKNIFVDNIYKLSYSSLKENNTVLDFLEGLIDEQGDKTIKKIMTPKPLNIMRDGLSNVVDNLDKIINKDYLESIDSAFEGIYEILKCDEIIGSFIENIEEKTIIEVLGRENSKKLILEIKGNFITFILSPKGKKTLNHISKMIIGILKEQNIPLNDIINQNMHSKVDRFFIEQLPEVISEASRWLRNNKNSFENAIENSVDEVISECGFIKKPILELIRDVFLNNIASRYQIVDKGIEYLEKYKDDRELGKEISEKALKVFKNKTIGEIIKDLEKNKVLSVERIEEFLKFNLEEVVNKIPDDTLLSILNFKIKNFIPSGLDLVSLIGDKVRSEAKVLITKNLDNGRLEKELKKLIKEQCNLLKEKKMSEFIENGEDLEDIEKYIIKLVNEKEDAIKTVILSELEKTLESKQISDLLSEKTLELTQSNIKEIILMRVNVGIEEVEEKDLVEHIKNLSKINNINENTTDAFLRVVDSNLENILAGKISSIVEKNIKELSNEQLNEMVNDFMGGKELKKINYFGSGLGFLAGAVTSFLSGGNIAQKLPIYALIGIVTNALAIEMLFKPYLGIGGVIPKNKPKFAKDMSKFVSERLLCKEVATETFVNQRDIILNQLKNEVAKEDYKLIKDLIIKESDVIFDKVYNVLKEKTFEYKDVISREIGSTVGDIGLELLPLEELRIKLLQVKTKTLVELEEIVLKEVHKKLASNDQIEDIFSKKTKEKITSILQVKIEELIDQKKTNNLKEDKLLKLLYDNLKNYNSILDKKIVDIAGGNNELKKNTSKYIEALLEDNELKNTLKNSIKDGFYNEFDKNKRMEELFDGKMLEIIRDNKEKFIRTTYSQMEKGFNDQKDSISSIVIDQVQQQLGFFQELGYNVIGGDDLIRKIVSKFIDNKVPYLIQDSERTLETIIENIIYKFSKSKVEEFSIELNSNNMSGVIEKVIKSNIVKSEMGEVSNIIIKDLMDKAPKHYLRPIGIKSIADIFKLIESESLESLATINTNLEDGSQEISKLITKIIDNFIKNEVYSLEINHFLKGTTKEDIDEVVKSIYKNTFSTKSFSSTIEAYLAHLIEESKSMDISEFIPINNFEKNIKALLESEEWYSNLKLDLKSNTNEELGRLIISTLDSIDDSTKDEILDIIMGALIESLSKNINGFLEALNISGVTESEIFKMDDQKIKEVFIKIAGKYFKRLKIYGVGGWVFGINNIITIISGIVFYLHSRKRKNYKTMKKELV